MSWLVAVAQHQGRQKISDFLDMRGLTSYHPTAVVRKPKKGWIEEPLFGRYFFIEWCKDWMRALWVPGVHSVLMSSPEHPSVLPDSVVEEIRQAEVARHVKRSTFRKGQSVRIGAGPFQGMVGRYLSASSKDREEILLQILGSYAKVVVAAGSLEGA